MFGRKNKKLPEPDKSNMDSPVKAIKQGKERTLRITVFPREGGRPYVADVTPSEEGVFDLQEKQTYKVSRGSVWEENGVLRAIVNEGNPNTISAFSLVGDDTVTPTALHGIASNNLWIQLDSLAKRKSVWKSAGTWGIIILGVVFLFMMLWQIRTMGNGFESLQASLDGLRTAGSTAATQAGHQSIAPGG